MRKVTCPRCGQSVFVDLFDKRGAPPAFEGFVAGACEAFGSGSPRGRKRYCEWLVDAAFDAEGGETG